MAKILLVDDEPDIELLAKQKFRKQIASGIFEIFYAQNGQEALDFIKKVPDIAVVVTDVNMPEMDGITLLDKLKEISPMTKTIIVSAYGDLKTLRAAMNKGVFDFVTKPVDFNELANIIDHALAQHYASSSLLYSYQCLLASAFPKGIDLSCPHTEQSLLWDVFSLNSQQLMVMAISILPSPIPMDIGVSVAHGLLKAALREDPDLPLHTLEKKLFTLHPDLKIHALLGHYHKESHAFSYKATGTFNVRHMTTTGETSLPSSHITVLNLGDVILFENSSSPSRLSLLCIPEE
jgi:CheY-like chemotaxis protein